MFAKLASLFFSKKMEIVLVGLENAGKSTFCNYLSMGKHVEEPPTIGLNVKIMKKNGIKFKLWDIGGQAKYRSEWPRYTKGCNVIVFVVDTQRPDLVPTAKKELHQLLEDR
jgi:ADP-ribosylation factor-like protein 8